MKFGEKANEMNRSFFMICSVRDMKFLCFYIYFAKHILLDVI